MKWLGMNFFLFFFSRSMRSVCWDHISDICIKLIWHECMFGIWWNYTICQNNVNEKKINFRSMRNNKVLKRCHFFSSLYLFLSLFLFLLCCVSVGSRVACGKWKWILEKRWKTCVYNYRNKIWWLNVCMCRIWFGVIVS